MKKYFLIAFVLVVMLLAACSNGAPLEFQEVTVTVSDALRGIAPELSLETDTYTVVVKGKKDGATVFQKDGIQPSSGTVSFQVLAGQYQVTVDAYNADGVKIGSGETEATVSAGKSNAFVVKVTELEGNGTFVVSLKGNGGQTLKAKILDAAGKNILFEKELVFSEGYYSTDFTLMHGYYQFEVDDAGAGKVLKMDSLRILSGTSAVYSAEFSFIGKGCLEIVNEILPTPDVSIVLPKSTFGQEEELVATCTYSGFSSDAVTFAWYLDNGAIDGEGLELRHQLSGLAEGNHLLSVFVSDGNVIWSDEASFAIGIPVETIDVPLYVALYVAGEVNMDYSLWTAEDQLQYWEDIRQATIDFFMENEFKCMGHRMKEADAISLIDESFQHGMDYLCIARACTFDSVSINYNLPKTLFDVLVENTGEVYSGSVSYPEVDALKGYTLGDNPSFTFDNPFFLYGDSGSFCMEGRNLEDPNYISAFRYSFDSHWKITRQERSVGESSERAVYDYDEDAKTITAVYLPSGLTCTVSLDDEGRVHSYSETNGEYAFRQDFFYRADGSRSMCIEYDSEGNPKQVEYCDEDGNWGRWDNLDSSNPVPVAMDLYQNENVYYIDAAGRVSRIYTNIGFADVSYDGENHVSTVTYENGMSAHYSYEEGRLVSFVLRSGDDVIQKEEYVYDPDAGRITIKDTDDYFEYRSGWESKMGDQWFLLEIGAHRLLATNTITNFHENGVNVVYTYDWGSSRLQSVTASYVDDSERQSTWTYSYNSQGMISEIENNGGSLSVEWTTLGDYTTALSDSKVFEIFGVTL